MNTSSDVFNSVPLNSIGQFLRGRGVSKSDIIEAGVGVVLYGELYTKFDGVIKRPESFVDESVVDGSTLLEYGDILFPTAGESADEIGKPSVYLSTEKACAGGDIIIFRPSQPKLADFLVSALRTHAAFAYRYRMGQGQSIVHVSQGALEKHPVLAVNLATAQRIAIIRSTWDRAIAVVETLIAAKQMRKRAFMRRVFHPTAGKLNQLDTVLRKECKPLIPDANSGYREIGIRSHGKGIFHKKVVSGASLGNKRVYRVKPDCFVFNVVFAWEQAVARTTAGESGMIASHR